MENIEEKIQENVRLQESMNEAAEGYRHLYYAALLRGDKLKAEKYRELFLAITGQLLDLHALVFELQKKLVG